MYERELDELATIILVVVGCAGVLVLGVFAPLALAVLLAVAAGMAFAWALYWKFVR